MDLSIIFITFCPAPAFISKWYEIRYDMKGPLTRSSTQTRPSMVCLWPENKQPFLLDWLPPTFWRQLCPTVSTLSYWCIWFGKPINRILSYYNYYIHNGLKASWTRVVFISFQFLVVIFDGFSKWSIPRSLWNFEKKIIKNWNQGYIW